MSQNELVLKWGIVSAGAIAQDFATAMISLQSNYHVLQAVGARNLQDAEKFAKRFNIPSFYGSYEELIADNDINVVYVASVNKTHKDIVVKALNAGKHVLCINLMKQLARILKPELILVI
jgi:dihydrodiol dehydrogenase / D-xylose 1-dehydrogenase (NADP)